MASIEEGGNGMVMPVSPINNGSGGAFGADAGWWIVLLIVILFGRGGMGTGVVDNGMGIQAGFNQAALSSGINSIQQAICNGFAQAEIAANNRQMADMQQYFSMQQQFANCCCENRLGIANLQSQIYQENCADRQAISDALMNVTQQMNAGFQSMRDEFCKDRLDRKDEIIAELRQQINDRDRQASMNLQTQQLMANNEAQTTAIEQYLAPVAKPAYIVQNPNCCQNYGYGCGAMVA